MQVLAFPESIEPARKLADTIGGEFGVIDIHRFPDGESLVTLPTRIAKSVIFFRSLHDPNAKLVELLLAIESARSNGCKRVMLIAPYLCYMRQDIAFKPGQAISQRIIGELLSEWVDDLITIDPHLHRITHLNVALPYCNSVAATASIALGDFIRQRNIQGLLVGPDAESAQWVEQVAQQAGLQCLVASKQRFGDRDVKVTLPDVNVRGKQAILVDDVISSGKTMIETAQVLKEAGASGVSAICTHALFAPGALDDMRSAGIDPIWSTDSIPHSTNAVDLTGVLVEALHELTGDPR
jgi:ribose-phosphate pyrophosphokinase